MRAPDCPALGILLIALVSITAAREVRGGDHSILQLIASPQELLFPFLPASYTVAVRLSGPVADEMARSVKAMGFPQPRYEEIFDRKKGTFRLMLANQDCPLETRDLIAGILNPTEMIGAVIRSLVKYRDHQALSQLAGETTIGVEAVQVHGRMGYRIRLLPLGERFDYRFEDVGAFIRESWSSEITLYVDSTRFLLHSLTAARVVRNLTAEQLSRSPPESTLHHYEVTYDSSLGNVLPSGLRVSVNGRPALAIAAAYRRLGDRCVFSLREITAFGAQGQEDHLVMSYQDYRLGKSAGLPGPVRTGARGTIRRLSSAAELSRRAAAQLREGDMSAAARTLQSLVDDYGGTPQAVAARELLSALPRR